VGGKRVPGVIWHGEGKNKKKADKNVGCGRSVRGLRKERIMASFRSGRPRNGRGTPGRRIMTGNWKGEGFGVCRGEGAYITGRSDGKTGPDMKKKTQRIN